MNRWGKGVRLTALLLAFLMILAGCQTTPGSSETSEGEGSKMPQESYEDILKRMSTVPEAADVDMYELSSDKGLIYNPLSREAEKTGVLNKYDGTDRIKGTLSVDGVTVSYSLPKAATAYDLIPIDYELKSDGTSRYPLHIEANAYEDTAKNGGNVYYDNTLPGNVDITWEYLGYVTGHFKDESLRNKVAADNTDTPAEAYPNYTTTPLTKSGTVETGDIAWFRFRYTNTGNTILDQEGAGGLIFKPTLVKDGDDSTRVPYNLYYRLDDYFYPGESGEVWINFGRDQINNTFGFALEEGTYTINLNALIRNDTTSDCGLRQMWEGPQVSTSSFRFTAKENATVTPPEPVAKGQQTVNATKNMYLAKYEEFMTSYDTIKSSSRTDVKGTIWLQVAPWTNNVALKVITGAPNGIAGVNIPIDVESDSIKIQFNPNNQNYQVVDGKKVPLFISQTLASMRANVQVSPTPEEYIVEDILQMKELGVNYLATDAMPWIFETNGSGGTPGAVDAFNPFGDAYKYSLDVARLLGIRQEGMMTYPINRGNYQITASFISKKPFIVNMTTEYRISTVDPKLPEINSILANYYFNRWGDNYYQYPTTGRTPVCTEDTRGWMRVDNNSRYIDGALGAATFAKWAKEKYGSLEEINKAWGTSYTKLSEINPESMAVPSPNGHGLQYLSGDHAFVEWSQALCDFDVFRTHIRMENYKDILAGLDDSFQNPGIAIRTEGANWLVSGIPTDTTNQRYRHVVYSQRRCGMIAEIVQYGDSVISHSDYTTLPYSPSEVRELTRMATEQGINEMLLPCISKMRDVAINKMYGENYKIHYNLKSSGKGAIIHTLPACFPWFQAIYEEGGTPGIMWEDIECDGVVTATQRKEIAFYQEKLQEALDTPEGKAWVTDLSDVVATEDWRKDSLKKFSVKESFIQAIIDESKG